MFQRVDHFMTGLATTCFVIEFVKVNYSAAFESTCEIH